MKALLVKTRGWETYYYTNENGEFEAKNNGETASAYNANAVKMLQQDLQEPGLTVEVVERSEAQQ